MSNTVEEIKIVLLDELGELLRGAKEDIEEFGLQIATDLAEAAILDDEEAIDELKAQAAVLAEAKRLDVVDTGWDTIGRVIGMAGGLLLRLGVGR